VTEAEIAELRPEVRDWRLLERDGIEAQRARIVVRAVCFSTSDSSAETQQLLLLLPAAKDLWITAAGVLSTDQRAS
jgi:hypothetical protein